jgi:hypothetical protein
MSGEIESQGDYKFVDGLSDDHFPHVNREQRCALGYGFPLEYIFIRSIGGPIRIVH